MTKFTATKVKNILLTTALLATASVAGGMATTSNAAAMTLHNCIAKPLYIRLRGQNSNVIEYSKENINPGQTTYTDLSRSQNYRMLIGVGAARKQYSGWKATEELSLRTIGGNTEISRGNFCPKAAPKPKPGPTPIRIDIDVDLNRLHLAWCFAHFDNYDPSTNVGVDRRDGQYRFCQPVLR